MTSALLFIHIASGALALVGLIACFVTRKGSDWHRRMGRVYSYSMAFALLAALLLSLIVNNYMLLVISFFSAYLVYTGWRAGARRESMFSFGDKCAVIGMLLTAIVMFVLAIWMYRNGDSMSVTVGVFGGIGGALAIADFKRMRKGWATGRERIILHLTRMSAASIATLTAVFVVNVSTDPAFIAWLLPTVVVTPLIFYWVRRVRMGAMLPRA